MFKVFLKRSNDRTIALVAGPACSPAEIERWLGESPSDNPTQFQICFDAISFARDSDSAMIAWKGCPGWPDHEYADIERIIHGH